MAKYKETNTDVVIDLEALPLNRCLQKTNKEYQDWLAKGNTPNPADPVTPPTYAELRALAYASIGDQLDMQYQDALNGTTTWQDHITSVKIAIPKV